MKRLFLFLLFAIPAFAQQYQFTAPDCQFEFRFNVVGGAITSTTSLSAQRLPLSQGGSNVVGYDNRSQKCTSWTVVYQTQGVTTPTLEMDAAPIAAGDVPGSWVSWPSPAPGTVFPITTAGTNQASAFGYNPWVSVNLNSAGGTGTVYGGVYGWRPQAGSDVTAPGNSVVVAGFTYKAITTSTNTQVKATAGTIHTLTITQPGATGQAITLVDTSVANCTGGVTILSLVAAQLATPPVPLTLTLDAATVNGICVITAGTTPPQLVLTWR